MEVERFILGNDGKLHPDDNGPLVRYSDWELAVRNSELRRQLHVALKQHVAKLTALLKEIS